MAANCENRVQGKKAKFSKRRIGIVASEKKKKSIKTGTFIDFFYDIEFSTKAERLQTPSYVFS